MEEKEEYLVHYWQLPGDLFITLKDDFHTEFCNSIKEKLNSNFKNCSHEILNCPKWHAQRLFNQFTRFTIKEIEILRKFAQIPEQEIEKEISSIGNHEDGAFIKNPNLPFHLKDLIYVASHLMFDGSYREKKGCYFYSYEDSLTEYHKKRLSNFGEVPINFMEGENQLYFSYTIGYIASKVLEIGTFKSTKCHLSEIMRELCKEKIFVDEVIKAMLIDEGDIEDKIKVELSNQRLVEDLFNIIKIHYKLTKPLFRERKNIHFKEYPLADYNSNSWTLNFSAKDFGKLFDSLSPLPINYKQEALEFLYNLQNNNQFHRKHGETKKLITASLLKQSKTFFELAKELNIRRGSVSAHIRKLPFITVVNHNILRRGGYAKESIFGIKNIEEAQKFLDTDVHYTRNYKSH